MHNGQNTIETRLFEKTELESLLDGPVPYTHVIFRIFKRIRKANVKDYVMAKLGGRMAVQVQGRRWKMLCRRDGSSALQRARCSGS